jgi:hypothetical protein
MVSYTTGASVDVDAEGLPWVYFAQRSEGREAARHAGESMFSWQRVEDATILCSECARW